jgi:hypothetical protein
MIGPPPQVALLRNPPEDRRLSMERFAGGLETALTNSKKVKVASRTVNDSSFAKRFGMAAPEVAEA